MIPFRSMNRSVKTIVKAPSPWFGQGEERRHYNWTSEQTTLNVLVLTVEPSDIPLKTKHLVIRWHLQEAHLRHHSGFSIAASRLALSNANFISYGEVLDQDQIWAQTSDPHRKTEHQIERLTKDPQLVPATAPFAAQSDSTSSAMTAA
ncbi:hypothetical protein LR48_Vigan01g198900 [Vigna angularis]|uniref:Uncharacterized protein n=1 Tax=Phaseolus angularis TaxID=3914 RepID=A0A0L9TPC7_PHAAN|nr:hypothetical protein LR48_Vigan01g198900 [Vigna angularis]